MKKQRNQVIRSDIFQMKILVVQDQVITALKQENAKLKLRVLTLMKSLVMSIFGILT